MRETTLINDGWYFSSDVRAVPREIPRNAERITLPHTWNAEDGTDGGNDYFRGKCLYMRPLSLKELPRGEKYYVEFKGVNSVAEVYFNDRHIMTHKGGYSTFRCELENVKNENILALLVSNEEDKSVYPQMADFTFYGGIYRSVSVISLHGSHFELDCYGREGLKVTPKVVKDGAEIDVEVFITNAPERASLLYRIEDKEGFTVAEEKTAAKINHATFNIEKPKLWRGRSDPYLYTVTVSLLSEYELLDRISSRFGIRSYRVDPERGFILNGEPYPLRGVSRHQDRQGVGNALTKKHHDEDMSLIAEMGANAIRLAHYQHDGYFYDLCDEYGMVVWAEIPYISKHEPEANDNAKEQLKELVLQNYNHPSIFFWGLSNEITMSENDEHDLIEMHEKLNGIVKTYDPTRLTGIAAVSMCDTDHPYLKIPDVVGYNHYFGWYGGSVEMNGPWFDKFHAEHPDIPICVTEYGCEALNWHSSDPRQGDYSEEYQAYYHEKMIEQLYSRPYIFASFVWNMFDFGADARSEGGEAGQNHKGLVTFDRQYKKDAFYAYKAYLSEDPFVHIAGKRYRKRPENLTRVTVYSNLPQVELYSDGKLIGKEYSMRGVFRFEVPLLGCVSVTAKAGSHVDTAVFERCDALPEEYVLKESGTVLNWFEVTSLDGYFSLNDEIGEILKTDEGAELFSQLSLKMTEKLDTGMTIDEKMMQMLSGFSVLRFINTVGSMIKAPSKDELLEINRRLNMIKKP